MKELYRTNIAKCSLSGEWNGWNLSFHEESIQENCSVFHIGLKRESAAVPPKLLFTFGVPMIDAQVKWHPRRNLFDSHHFQPRWWGSGKEPFMLNRDVGVYSWLNLEGINSVSFACSEMLYPVQITSGPLDGEGFENEILTDVYLFPYPCEPGTSFEISVRIDRRRIFYADVLFDMTAWLGEKIVLPMPIPETCRMPIYSTWYQFQKNVTQKALENELDLMMRANLGTLIIDDGWQCAKTDGGGSDMSTCGEWNVSPGKFPDMKSFIARCHEKCLKVLFWVALPYIGIAFPNLIERFRNMTLSECSDHVVLDPRYPEVRHWLTERCVRLVEQYHLDGLKLDFIDSMTTTPENSNNAQLREGCDTVSLVCGIDRLLKEISSRLTAIDPDIMIEFRQHYTSPLMKQYANIFRASDCPHDLLQNRVRTLDMRLLGGDSAVHSDMIIWSVLDSPETAALQILSVLFATPQISCRLSSLPESHFRMLSFWMDFCRKHCRTLQFGRLRPEHPESSYPAVTSESDDESITVIYGSDRIVRLNSVHRHIVINASHAEGLVVESANPCNAVLYNTFGEKTGRMEIAPGLTRIPVPLSGFAVCEMIES